MYARPILIILGQLGAFWRSCQQKRVQIHFFDHMRFSAKILCRMSMAKFSRMGDYNSLRIARKRAVNIHPESRSKSGQISIFLLPPHDRVTLGGRFVPCRPQGAGVLACHLQFVRSRSIIKEVRSLSVPSSISPSRPASPPPPPRPRAQRCAGAFPPPPVSLFHPYPPALIGCAFGRSANALRRQCAARGPTSS